MKKKGTHYSANLHQSILYLLSTVVIIYGGGRLNAYLLVVPIPQW